MNEDSSFLPFFRITHEPEFDWQRARQNIKSRHILIFMQPMETRAGARGYLLSPSSQMTQQKNIECPLCTKKFAKRIDLLNHQRDKHSPPSERPRNSEDCARSDSSVQQEAADNYAAVLSSASNGKMSSNHSIGNMPSIAGSQECGTGKSELAVKPAEGTALRPQPNPLGEVLDKSRRARRKPAGTKRKLGHKRRRGVIVLMGGIVRGRRIELTELLLAAALGMC
ncbi:hypothetical protein K432DRAFT_397637 [Lepidopterella palustris CBS 459.81]|uniref:C2H2-type domain-containing protein n=1 Tax=Lepidopterella palustris CBS 459.81 TaxID=1314670 RepID=A0A8E2JA69_9PEZI|nr:hypothetical protein K432DRAFT_397637 [Lepidopterella palustris CBS 459.81]